MFITFRAIRQLNAERSGFFSMAVKKMKQKADCDGTDFILL